MNCGRSDRPSGKVNGICAPEEKEAGEVGATTTSALGVACVDPRLDAGRFNAGFFFLLLAFKTGSRIPDTTALALSLGGRQAAAAAASALPWQSGGDHRVLSSSGVRSGPARHRPVATSLSGCT